MKIEIILIIAFLLTLLIEIGIKIVMRRKLKEMDGLNTPVILSRDEHQNEEIRG